MVRVFIFLPLMFLTLRSLGQISEKIKINQVGYLPSFKKIAVYTGEKKDIFIITDAKTGDTLLKGKLSEPQKSAYSSLNVQIADFSSFRKSGRFILSIPGVGSSFTFNINEHIFKSAGSVVLKAFYYIRSDMPLEVQFARKWSRPAGHPDTAVLVHPSAADSHRPEGMKISSPGGWYDAGDYNKYIVNSGISMATLMSAYEDFPGYFNNLKTNIPESNDRIPDLLNEAIYNLRWMMTMQDPSDGGVYHKCTNAAFDGMVMPGETKLPRYVVQKSTAATLDFAAVMAQMSRITRPFAKQLPGLADSCKIAAIRAWNWSVSNQDSIYDQKKINQIWKPAITTGEYGDRRFSDEWFWAATELLITTGERHYYDTIIKNRNLPGSIPSWNNTAMLGYYSLALHASELPGFAQALAKSANDSILRIADVLIAGLDKNAYHTVIGQSVKDFIWGSNSVAANQGVLLVKAWKLSGKNIYLDGALSNLDYILGRNGLGICFVTGLGDKSPMHPHHRPSVADQIEDPVPGLLVGGPNPGQQDNVHYPSKEPELSYVDDDRAYACNEIAINWNAPAVYLINAVQAASYVNKSSK